MAQDTARVFDVPREIPRSRNRLTLVTFLTLLVISLSVTLWMVLPYLVAVIMGSILALLAHPFYQKLQRRNIGSRLASLLVTLAIVCLVIVPVSMFVMTAVKQAIALGERISSSGELSFHAILLRLSAWRPIETLVGSPETLEKQARVWIQSGGAKATSLIVTAVGNVPDILLQLALALIACFFFLIDGKRFLSWMAGKIPVDSDVRTKVVDSFKETSVSVIWATLAAAAAQAAMMLFSFLVLNVPLAFLAAGATFIFAWIPIVGSVPVWVTGAIYLYTQASIMKAVLMVGLGLLTSVIDNFVRPLVLKGRGNMHPLVSLVAIFGGVGVFGIVGVFIGPIITAVLISLLQIWPAVGQRFGLPLDR